MAQKNGYKIRQHTLKKVPFMVIVGANEVETGQVNLRLLNGEQQSFADFTSATSYLVQATKAPDLLDQQKALEASIRNFEG